MGSGFERLVLLVLARKNKIKSPTIFLYFSKQRSLTLRPLHKESYISHGETYIRDDGHAK